MQVLHMMSKYLSTILLLGFLILCFTNCQEQQPYEAETESIYVINSTDETVFLQYDSTNFYIGNSYASSEGYYLDSIPSGGRGGTYITYKNFNFIMPDSTFSRIISSMQIFKIKNGDTLYVKVEKYNQRSAWRQEIDTDFEAPTNKYISNELVVNDSIF